MTGRCPRCRETHPTEIEALACTEVNGGEWAELTAVRRARLALDHDECWEAALDAARRRALTRLSA